jgi:hypothetical protein
LLVGLVVAESIGTERENDRGLARRLLESSARLGVMFVAPLLLWMALIAVRYDVDTLEHWVFSYVTFVAKHAADVRVMELPVYQGWRFDPAWNAMPLLGFGWRETWSYLGPLVVGWSGSRRLRVVARRRVLVRLSPRRSFSQAACAAAAMAVTWFFTLDPTQWGRHLMPAIYVSVFVALYCGGEIYRSVAAKPAAAIVVGALAYAAVLTGAYYAYSVTRDYAASNHWRISYSRNCRGNVLEPPCQNNDTLDLIEKLGKEWCGPDTQMFSPTDYCKGNNRRRVVEHAIDILGDPEAPKRLLHDGGYLLTLIQVYDYQTRESFLDDFGSVVCHRPTEPLRRRLLDLGVDEGTLADACARSESRASGGAETAPAH